MNQKKLLLLLSIFFQCSFFSVAQSVTQDFEFGAMTKEEFLSERYEVDTSAVAYYVGDYGELWYENGNGFLISALKRTVRIKILKTEGLKYADLLLKYQNGGGSIRAIKGNVYNLVNNKLIKEELRPENIYEEELTDYAKSKKISFRNVKVGSIIEYSYIKRGGFYFSKWEAQKDIPVKVSDFIFKYPNVVSFHVRNSAFYPLTELPSSTTNIFFNFNMGLVDNNQIVTIRHWREENIPSFREEPHMSAPNDKKAKIEIEFSRTNIITQENYSTWHDIMKLLLMSKSCGGELGKVGYMKSSLKKIKNSTDDKIERAKQVYTLIQERMTWNGQEGITVGEGGLKKAYDQRKGNVAEINLMLVNALREVGVSAFALLGNTRSNGKIERLNPSLYRLGYLIVYIQCDGEEYFLDATSKDLPFNILPKKALNYQGVVMSDNLRVNGRFVTIPSLSKDEFFKNIDLEITPDLTVKGSYKGVHKGYNAVDFLEEYNKDSDKEVLIGKIEEKHEGLIVNSYAIQGVEKVGNTPIETVEFEIENCIKRAGDSFIINPLQVLDIMESPFKLEERKYPVEFPYPLRRAFTVKLKLPDGFSFKELPTSTRMNLIDNKSGSFRYVVAPNGNEVMIMVDFRLNKMIFLPEEYPFLKKFFEDAYALQFSSVAFNQSQ
ncbi:DUF3857 domain-containing protein [Flammeovirga aprica]|uniref:DUF3857 domain-containing protein n=1 Tax=Flammeovirga aprica JL-4 TaxID=694437 RepID=A0A7X9NZZ8_9BACT|nr:DUF3857 domain-containing protein [Flammeovirga aprica]NME66472.1 DUF3857 domain-containing protein [Flammeovirga aprica JL-4]